MGLADLVEVSTALIKDDLNSMGGRLLILFCVRELGISIRQ